MKNKILLILFCLGFIFNLTACFEIVDSFSETSQSTSINQNSIEELQKRYEFTYFASMSDAIQAANTGVILPNVSKEEAYAGIYIDESDRICAVLLKDEVLETRIQPAVDMTIHLGGHVLCANNAICINVTGGNLIIDGTLEGSAIIQKGTASGAGCIQTPASGTASSVTIIGGTYQALNQSGGVACALNLKNTSCTTTVTDCTITATTANNKANAILNDGIAKVTNSHLLAYSNYHISASNYTAVSYGIWNTGTLTMKDSHAFGTHSGIATTGSIDITGGTFEGFGHGGMYIGGASITAIIRNATIKDSVTMPEGYTNTAPHNGAGMYIGGSSGNHMKVYMDNCVIYGSNYPIVLRGSSSETDNHLYISNCEINTDKAIRIDNETLKLYLGVGNNFTAAHTTLEAAVTETGEVYDCILPNS